MIDTFKKKTLT